MNWLALEEKGVQFIIAVGIPVMSEIFHLFAVVYRTSEVLSAPMRKKSIIYSANCSFNFLIGLIITYFHHESKGERIGIGLAPFASNIVSQLGTSVNILRHTSRRWLISRKVLYFCQLCSSRYCNFNWHLPQLESDYIRFYIPLKFPIRYVYFLL